MRDYRKLEEQFLVECRAYLNERADAQMAQIAQFEARHIHDSRALEDAYLEMLKTQYEQCDVDRNEDWERFMQEEIEQHEHENQIEDSIF